MIRTVEDVVDREIVHGPANAAAGIDIKCVGLTKTFRDFWMRPRVKAVEGVDLEIRRGQVYGLLGPNGSGKSTTIKMILGLLSPSRGRIAVLGHRPRDVSSKKHIGYLPEESYLYRFLSARETLDYYGRLFRIPARIRHERIDGYWRWWDSRRLNTGQSVISPRACSAASASPRVSSTIRNF